VIGFFSCSNHDTFDNPDPYQPVFDLFQGAYIQHIYLDEKKHQLLGPESYSVIEIPDEDVQKNGMSWATLINNTVYAVSQNMESIKAFNLVTDSLKEYSFLGRGPGEYQSISQLVGEESTLILVDGGSPRIKEYDLSFNFMDEYELDEFNMFYSIAYNNPYLIYPLYNNEEHLYRLVNLQNQSNEGISFHNRIISIGKQPRAYNRAHVDLNDSGRVAVLSANMPLLFLYSMNDNSGLNEPKKIVRFHHEHLEILGTETEFGSGFGENVVENPPPIEFEADNSVVVGVTPLFQSVAFTEEWVFIKQIPDNRLLVLKKQNNSFEYIGSYQFIDSDDQAFGYMTVNLTDSWLILGNLSENKALKVNISVFD
jgi:hypothetical protein